MASAAKTLARLAPRNPAATASFASRITAHSPRSRAVQSFAQPSRRYYSSSPIPPKPIKARLLAGAALVAAVGATSFYYYTKEEVPNVHLKKGSGGQSAGIFTPTKDDYQKVYNYIAELLWEKDDYDDGSYGPVLVRLAWHASGTYDKETNTGGSNGATMRFAPEGGHDANAGLKHARDFLEPVKGNVVSDSRRASIRKALI